VIFKRLRLENIRSYAKADVELPSGKTLFEGDIGSGKSTLLMAIEFALFGLGNARASSLLRVGEPKGSVELEFEANGKDYWVKRTLVKKGSSVQQSEGRLRGPEGEEDYPPTEMKERILSILNFREPTDPKARSLIYQYAIYTPQEEMKQVLLLRPDFRTQILRRAFGVEEYKTAMENAGDLVRAVQVRRSQFEFVARDAPELRKQAADLEAKLGKASQELRSLARAEAEAQESVTRLERQREEMRELEMQLAHALSERGHLGADVERQKDDIRDTRQDIEALERKVGAMTGRAALAGSPPAKSVEELRAVILSAKKDISKHEGAEVEMRTKIGQYESVAEKGKCPVCDREAVPEDFEGMVSDLSGKREKNSEHIRRLHEELESLEALVEKRRAYDVAAARAKDDAAFAEECKQDAQKKRKHLATLEAGIAASEKRLGELGSRIEILVQETKGLDAVRRELDAARDTLIERKERIAALKSDVRKWEADSSRVGDSLERAERAGAKAASLRDREIWLEEFFIPTLASIERHVMVSINREFDASFQRWFGMLVEDTGKEAKIDEEFTPIVEQEGFEQDVDFLSGGERTSVALAYRLALSQMVQKYAEAGPSSLILDEPTDGFSKEQLGKVREILDEMANPQVVIVSHERELESMADQIFRVSKVGGESTITR
jgi:exonuclease SbcC